MTDPNADILLRLQGLPTQQGDWQDQYDRRNPNRMHGNDNEGAKGEEPRPYQNVDAFSDVGIAVGAMAIDIEKLLCDALGIAWQPTGMGVSSLIESLKGELKEAREERDEYKRDEARALELLGKGLDDHAAYTRSQTIEECAKIADFYDAITLEIGAGRSIAKAIRSLDSNGGGKS